MALSFQVKAQFDNDDFNRSGIESFDQIEPTQIENNDVNDDVDKVDEKISPLDLPICKNSGEDCNDDDECCDYIKDKSGLCEVGSEDDVRYVCRKVIQSENISCNSDSECLNGLCENGFCRILEGEVCRNSSECSKNLKCIEKGNESKCLSKDSKLYTKKLNKKKNKKPNEKNYSARCGGVYQACCFNQPKICINDKLVCNSDNKCKPCGYPGSSCCDGGGCRMPSLVSCTSSNVCSYCGGTNDPCCTDPSKPPCRYSSDTCDEGTCKNCGGIYQTCCSGAIKCKDAGYSCDADSKCTPCGRINDKCCSAPQDPCNSSSLSCSEGKCQQCGYIDTPCCDGGVCMSGQCINGTCKNCGNIGNPCCTTGPACSFGQCLNGTCQQCGYIGKPCCNGNTCKSSNLQCIGGTTCNLCGGQGQSCCPSGNPCQVGNVCSGGTCKSCGSNNDDCCPLPNPNNNPCNSTSLICNAASHCEQCGFDDQQCCTKGNPCVSGTCNIVGRCQSSCAALNGTCNDSLRCCSGLTCQPCTGWFCSGGTCCKSLGNPCSPGECCSGLFCNAITGACTRLPTPTPTPTASPSPCTPLGNSCTNNTNCCNTGLGSGSFCVGGICCKASGGSCTNVNHCCSGLTCNSGICGAPTPSPTATPPCGNRGFPCCSGRCNNVTLRCDSFIDRCVNSGQTPSPF